MFFTISETAVSLSENSPFSNFGSVIGENRQLVKNVQFWRDFLVKNQCKSIDIAFFLTYTIE
ncbi:hypothetical protein DHL47_02915 [Streptococcus panodentis]|uniref:Uncharacterized protein n=1 Tax=Streptococcus panodentis TaxID=1581472 RepID=A0ABS5AVJ9_9STRE|nr:hypothetical protein [Streptococcus panodentis]